MLFFMNIYSSMCHFIFTQSIPSFDQRCHNALLFSVLAFSDGSVDKQRVY